MLGDGKDKRYDEAEQVNISVGSLFGKQHVTFVIFLMCYKSSFMSLINNFTFVTHL